MLGSVTTIVQRAAAPLEGVPLLVAHQAGFAPERSQTQIGIIVTQDDPMFGPRRQHAIRLVHAAGNEIVDQHADVALPPADAQRRRRRAPHARR